MSLRLGAKLPTTGELPARLGIPAMAARLERAGFDSLWVSDHVVMPERVRSRYPFAADGRAGWPTDTPWYDAIVALSAAAATTSHVGLGVAVLVLPLRHPVVLAKQAASLDAISGGRLTLGVGAGWLAEEFEALGVPFETRGSRLDEWIAILRACWTGRPPPLAGCHYRLPAGVLSFPTPARQPDILVGGTSPAALGRAGRAGQGWLGQEAPGRIDWTGLEASVAAVRRAAAAAGRDAAAARLVLRLTPPAPDGVLEVLPRLAAAGVTEVIVDVDWEAPAGPARDHDRLRRAAEAGGRC
ncbi:MAG TPA: TIGR03619 family F420-dependent LLM class oxidoreductase [Candidatus Dormibacteraeota bacterium]|nr:TIGR03619 family F420-dependent LLM class oxidoreductase [Candidatus Dormibacteraeota bacterium]